MSRARTILASLKLSSSLLSTQQSSSHPLLTQVTRSSLFSDSSLGTHSSIAPYCVYNHGKMYFSSKSSSILELVLENDWSQELVSQLENMKPSWTHESVIYILKKLDKDPEKAWNLFNWVCESRGFMPSSAVYSFLLRIFVTKDSMKKFWITVAKMKENGCYIDVETYTTIAGVFKKQKMESDALALKHFYDRMIKENAMDDVVKNVVSVTLEKEWGNEVEKQLSDMKLQVTDNFVIRVLKELRNRPFKAFRFFHWVSRVEGYGHNTVTYNAIARVVARDDSIREFWNVVEEMTNAGHEMDMDTYIKVSRQFQKSKLTEDAVKLYEFMMDSPFKPSVQDCSMLLRSISASHDPDLNLVFRVVKKFETAGNSLSKAVYDGMHRSLTRAGKFDDAEQIMKVMKNAGYEPDNITYSQLVFGLCNTRRLEEACKVLDEMEADGCIPDLKTWTILIQGHFAANEPDKALACFAKMMEKNFTADADLLDVLINGFLDARRIDDAYTLLLEMVNKSHLVPWQSTYKCVIEKLLGVSKLEEAMKVLQLMKKNNYPPFPEPFVQYISKFGTVGDAADFFQALSVKQYPSSSAYVHMFESLFKEGRNSEAKDLLYKCPHHIRKHPKICKLFGSAKSA